MSIKELKKQDWVLNTDNGLIFLRHPLLQMSVNFTAYQPTSEEIIAGCKLALSVPVVALDIEASEGDEEIIKEELTREDIIKAAVLAVLPENYGAAGFGRPAMPKVAEIKAATGLADVTAEDIMLALSVPVVATEGA